jgi:LPXTG-motif cell wall-anchored protein
VVADPRTWLNIGLALVLACALSMLLSGCAAGALVGPSTISCQGGGTATEIWYAPDYSKREVTCNGDLAITGHTSDNASTILGAALAALAGWLAAP